MLSSDLGGGRRLRRRPGSLFTDFFLFFLLFSFFSPSPIPQQAVSGDSDFSVWARSNASPVSTAFSTVRTLRSSLLASASGVYRPVDLELSRFLCSCLAGSIRFRSEATKLLMNESNLRSEPPSRLSLWFYSVSDLQLHCYHQSYCKRSSGPVQPRRLQYNTRKRLEIKASFDTHRRDVQSVRIEADHCCHCSCSSPRVRYNFFTPNVLNLLSKLFFWNFGSNIYGFNGVPVSMGIVSVSTYYDYWRKTPTLDRKCYRLCTGSILGLVAQIEHTDIISSMFITGELAVDLPNHALISQKFISVSGETERRLRSGKTAVHRLPPKLGQQWILLMGHEPYFVLLMGSKTQGVVPCAISRPFVRNLIGIGH